MALVVLGIPLKTAEQGFLLDIDDWNETVAYEIARLNKVELTDAHWEIIIFIHNYYKMFKHLPNTRVFTQAIKKKFGDKKGNSRYLHQLFPQGPLKYACKIAGLPKPPTCF